MIDLLPPDVALHLMGMLWSGRDLCNCRATCRALRNLLGSDLAEHVWREACPPSAQRPPPGEGQGGGWRASFLRGQRAASNQREGRYAQVQVLLPTTMVVQAAVRGNMLVTAAFDGRVFVYDLERGELTATIPAPAVGGAVASLDTDGARVALLRNPSRFAATLWDPAVGGEITAPVATFTCDAGGQGRRLGFVRVDGDLVASCFGLDVVVWSACTGEVVWSGGLHFGHSGHYDMVVSYDQWETTALAIGHGKVVWGTAWDGHVATVTCTDTCTHGYYVCIKTLDKGGVKGGIERHRVAAPPSLLCIASPTAVLWCGHCRVGFGGSMKFAGVLTLAGGRVVGMHEFPPGDLSTHPGTVSCAYMYDSHVVLGSTVHGGFLSVWERELRGLEIAGVEGSGCHWELKACWAREEDRCTAIAVGGAWAVRGLDNALPCAWDYRAGEPKP